MAKKKKDEEKEMSFFDHLEVLRWHIMRSVLAIVVLGIVVFLAKDFVFSQVILGPCSPEFITYRVICSFSNFIGAGDALCIAPKSVDLIAVEMGELFLTHIKVSLLLGLVLSFPYLFWEIWRFVKPGLYDKERNVTRYVVFICSALFLMGVVFGYFVVSPFAVSFLTGYEIPGVESKPTLGSYISYMVMFTLPLGVVFELPVAAHVLTRIGVLSSGFMKEYRRHAFVVIIILAGVITPPDAFSQILVTVPLYCLYELSIYVSKRVEKKMALEEEAENSMPATT